MVQVLLRIVAQKNLLFERKIEITSRRTTREKLTAYLLQEAKLRGTRRFTVAYDRQELADYLEVDFGRDWKTASGRRSALQKKHI